jgi:hypothetical protein
MGPLSEDHCPAPDDIGSLALQQDLHDLGRRGKDGPAVMPLSTAEAISCYPD